MLSRNKLWITSLVIAAVLLHLAASSLGGTAAGFLDTEASSGNSLRVASFADILHLSPGTSEAFRRDRQPQWQPIAQTDGSDDIILLDYGEVYPQNWPIPHIDGHGVSKIAKGGPEGSDENVAHTQGVHLFHNDVFRIKNIGNSSLEVRVEACGDAARFFVSVQLQAGGGEGNPLILAAGEEATVKTALLIPRRAKRGDYHGEMFISACGGFFEHRTPIFISVMRKGPHPIIPDDKLQDDQDNSSKPVIPPLNQLDSGR
jgi:hypothetical protein